MNPKILALAKKLKELSERGEGGERENASEALQRLLFKYGLTLADIIDNDIRIYDLKYPKGAQRFAAQVCGNVLGYKCSIYKNKIVNGLRLKCTPSQIVEISARLDFFWKAYQQELKLFYKAFVHKNGLGAPVAEEEDDDCIKLSPEEQAELYRMSEMMSGITRHQFRKSLPEPAGK